MLSSTRKHLVLALVAGFALAGAANAEPSGADPGIKKLFTDAEAAFNKQDTANARAKALLALATPDLTVSGFGDDPPWTKAQVETAWTNGFSNSLKSATAKLTVRSTHALKPDVVLIDADQEFSNVRGDDGKPQTTRARVVATVVKKNGRWLFSDLRQFELPEVATAAPTAK